MVKNNPSKCDNIHILVYRLKATEARSVSGLVVGARLGQELSGDGWRLSLQSGHWPVALPSPGYSDHLATWRHEPLYWWDQTPIIEPAHVSVTNLEMVNYSEQRLVSRLSGPPEYEYNLATTTADFQMENEILPRYVCCFKSNRKSLNFEHITLM